MASNSEYLTYVLELLREVEGISYKKMMGEYILYKDGKIFGGVYDNRFLVKKAAGLEKYHMKEQIPYPTEKPMFLIDSEDPEEIQDVVSIIVGK
ncbi:MAG: TfoX/Sxy family protein [Bacilli bacterium]|nr:TfoX/Sxy family protein [Bacilli bacterium]